jgi:hypothetical protein
MKITIQGTDYTAALDASLPLTIERKLNQPSICALALSLPTNSSLTTPLRNQSLTITGDNGTVYFTGYIAASPMPEYAGLALEGPRYRIAIQAISDEILLDQRLMPPSTGTAAQTAGALLADLVTHAASPALSTSGLTSTTPISSFVPDPGAPFSRSAGQVAAQARSAYRVLSGALALSSIPGVIHPLNETDGTLTLANLALTASTSRALANDITVCGEHEPAAYVTEYFQGDGATTQFDLAADPFFPAASKATIIHELFNEPAINSSLWNCLSGNSAFTLGASGLSLNGGTGYDGQNLLSWVDNIEMGGTLLLEASGVTLVPNSTGVLAAFYVGLDTQSSCVAGFRATAQSGAGAVSLQPLIQGVSTGTSYPLNPANQYTLRLRVYCADVERNQAVYRTYGDNGPIGTGGSSTPIGARLQFEIQEYVNGVAGMPVLLYDGVIAGLPPACTVMAASSISLNGSMRALNLTNLGPCWVISTRPTGSAYSRRIGTLAESAECHIDRSGKLVFYAGSAPVAGEQVAVSYRTVGRAVGRSVNAASQQGLAQAGLPSVACWSGSVTNPPCRSSADCRNAASAIVQAAAGVSALWAGTYRATNRTFPTDVWPGDALLINAPSANLNAQVVVRSVQLTYRSTMPDLVSYAIAFANDWADDLAIKTSGTIPADAWLPASVALTPLANLTALTVTALNGSTVNLNTGVSPPTGGGFEIRRRDFAFMPGEDPDLVARATVPTITFSRQSANDRFFIRMYDGATPPNFSEFSTALFINLPLAS